MKLRHFFIFLVFCSSVSLFALGARDADSKKVVVYAYDSFTAEWGLGPRVVKDFEAQTGYTLELVSGADGQELLAKVIAEKATGYADVVLGIDNMLADRAIAADVLAHYRPKNASVIREELRSKDTRLIPYDSGFFAIMFDTESGLPEPKSLRDLTKPIYKRSIVLMDPRTSTPGLGFLAWTRSVFGDAYLDYWKALKPSMLTMSPNWSTGYGMFTSGEAPMVISYTSSMAYHIRYENTRRFKALAFSDGHTMQIEYMGLLKNAPNSRGGKAFIDFMLSKKVQNLLPETQWMYPASREAVLPPSFNDVPMPKALKALSGTKVQQLIDPLFDMLSK